jgi:hypothetical protein
LCYKDFTCLPDGSQEAQASFCEGLRGLEEFILGRAGELGARGGGGNLNPNGRGLTEQVRVPSPAAGEEDCKGSCRTAKVTICDRVVLQRFLLVT